MDLHVLVKEVSGTVVEGLSVWELGNSFAFST